MTASSRAPLLLYVATLGCIGTAAIVHSLSVVIADPVDWHWLLLAGLTAASSAAVLQMSSSPAAFSVAEIFTFTALLLFGPAVGVLTVAIDCAVISLRLAIAGLPAKRVVVNLTAPTLAMWIAAHLLFGFTDVKAHLNNPLSLADLALPLSASALLYFLLDTWSIAVAVALETHQRAWQVWRTHFAQLWVSFLVGAHAAGLIAVALGGLGLSFLVIVAPLPLMLYYAMRTWVGRVNDRLRLLAEISERDRRFMAVFDSALDALLLVDDDRRIVDANPAACSLLNVQRVTLPHEPIEYFLAPASADEVRRGWAALVESNGRLGELTLSDGAASRDVEFSFKASVLPGRHLFIWRDVSDRKRLQAQLQQSQKMETVGRLAGGVAHDFNNLLTVILGNAGLLLDTATADTKEHVTEILGAADRAAGLTRQLLAFSRKQVLQSTVLNLNGIVTNVETLLRRLLGEPIALQTRMDPAVWPVKVDSAQLEQVIVNLAVNARDAMPNGGRIVIETANVEIDSTAPAADPMEPPPGAYVRMTVADTGTGMDAATLAQIFEPFFTTKERDRGTGLGLAMVYGIVRQSGGYITVESEVGKGSTFAVYLPRTERSTHPARENSAAPAPVPTGTETVLIVEDERALRGLAGRTLSRYGYTIVEAASAEEACDLFDRSQRIDLVLTDVVMPGMNGQDLALALRGSNPRLPIIFMSGYAGEALQVLPGSVFLQKPFTPATLARCVRRLLDRADELTGSGSPAGGHNLNRHTARHVLAATGRENDRDHIAAGRQS